MRGSSLFCMGGFETGEPQIKIVFVTNTYGPTTEAQRHRERTKSIIPEKRVSLKFWDKLDNKIPLCLCASVVKS